MEKLRNFLTVHKVTVILIAVLGLLALGVYFAFQKFAVIPSVPVEEIDLSFDSEGPYALLFPRRDGNALILNLKRTSSYENISYELAYTAEGVDRGVMGEVNTKEKKGEYEQEILFGTCSKNVCKYDQGVENGTLVLKIKKGNKLFRMITQWHLQKPDVALGVLSSGDAHLVYKMDAEREALSAVGFTIINDLTGVPKLPAESQVLGKVYSLNAPVAKSLPEGDLSVELAENPPDGAKLFRFDGSKWQELETKVDGSKLSSKSGGAGIFAVLIPQK
ncbi:hypothetical protein A3H81_00595 [Candidatus Daviesbacteria bacterium RIFCSPLOWO2_02_FULL_38_18]|nr:MAG: hypothetical protein US80_C0002G0028 [Candidatus Daviesbacteria bacterium GW2011_GWA2_38_17]OGE44577.1 MAG: hypothetical protein A3E67_02540 [Candidatus Daviesbacteria bacterium RIFCSPHIGHO2_12_FULL_38_25]OGE68766.1 MAG: hypothetical protein A3H81_00595 [Candidatus Daviesbacteria bacterium RIFCSPLOWO2_02_FULL_38_18]OGE73299.1 MAG: hypothetical protein A3H18_04540 [Candidatus Daviesbacteria bacterium RIFCSPLOWO2_12_FULL_38_10]HCB23019.1 hypothetical protein [Candidatus Daviesbacteria bac